jgi:hypothetical protein
VKVTTSPARTAGILGFTALAILFAHVGAVVVDYFVDRFWGDEQVAVWEAIYKVFYVGFDSSIPTWYSSLVLLLCSVLLAAIAVATKQRNDRYTFHWGLLSFIFLLLSMDEVARIHEGAIGEVSTYVATSMGYTPKNFLSYFWVVPGAIFVLVVLLMYLRFLAHLPKKTLLLFLLAGLIFVGGAIGVEMTNAQLESLLLSGATDSNSTSNKVLKVLFLMMITIGEALEMLGVIVFVYALLSYMRNYSNEVTVQINTKGGRRRGFNSSLRSP